PASRAPTATTSPSPSACATSGNPGLPRRDGPPGLDGTARRAILMREPASAGGASLDRGGSMKPTTRSAVLVVVALALAACARSYEPIVDMKGVDQARYQQDLAECRAYAEQVSPA